MDETNKTTGTMNEKTLNALLEYASVGYIDSVAQLMDNGKSNEEEQEAVVPPEFDEQMKRFIHKYEQEEERRRAGRKARKVLIRAAVILLIIGGSLGVLSPVGRAARTGLYNFILEVREKFTNIYFNKNEGNAETANVKGIPSDWHDVYVPTYVPEGFKVANAKKLNVIRIIDYENSKGESINFNESPIEGNDTQLDTENAKVEKITIKENEGMLIEKKGDITLVWHDNANIFTLSARLDKNELFKMAESVKKLN